MKTNKLAGSICALLLTALGASSAVAQTSTASIVFTRTVTRAIDGTHGTALYRVQPSGANVVQLVPATYGVDQHGASWSPGGASVVYESLAQPGNPSGSQLYVVNRQGSSPRRITTGPGVHEQPLWGPNGIIAFVTTDSGKRCLGTVRGDGTNQHIVFCPPREPGMSAGILLTLSQWTASGNGVLVVAGADDGGLEPEHWYSNIYRVNVSTGAVAKLAGQVFDQPGPVDLTIAPDGKHGVYEGYPRMRAIDFATNTLTPLSTDGSGMLYSPDGTKIAFTRFPQNSSYFRVSLMRADGSNVREAPTQSDPNFSYPSIAGWSSDSTRLLVNQVGDDRLLRIIDLRSRTATNVTRGTAEKHAWFHP